MQIAGVPVDEALKTGGTILGTGVPMLWITKTMVNRFIKKNDEKHDKHEKAVELQNKVLNEINTTVAVINSRMGEVMSLREDVKSNVTNIAVAEVKLNELEKDLTAGFSGVRERFKNLKESDNA